MARRRDPERIYQARRVAIRNRLLSDGLSPETAERWLAAWELEASARGVATSGDFWTVGDAWIAEQPARRR
jgi:hypothetical protein